ncbi:MAG: hypothetical protein ACJAS9_002109 [Polaribacter sp.]|jgi:hypothetical protein
MTVRLINLFMPSSKDMPSRRLDLDWLRVLAFGLLIFYHTGMLYVADWDFHVKSQYLSQNLQSVMLLVNPWRMAILWMISGIAIRFILAKVSLKHFLVTRSYRLLLPLLFAILVIIPPQLYYEMTQNGDLNLSYWEFYKQFFNLENLIFEKYSAGIWHHIDVNHLWYLRELWRFSLYLVILLPLFNSRVFKGVLDWFSGLNGYLSALIIAVPIFLIELLIEDTKEPLGFLFLIYGYLLGWNTVLWQKLKENAFLLLALSLILYVAIIIFYQMVWLNMSEQTDKNLLLIGTLVYSLDRLVWVLAILAIGFRFLDYNSSKLQYLSEAVYPFYILHQTIIIVIGFEITQYHLGGISEACVILFSTFLFCFIGFEIIRRIDWIRPLFGLKMVKAYPPFVTTIMKSLSVILIVGLGLEILI